MLRLNAKDNQAIPQAGNFELSLLFPKLSQPVPFLKHDIVTGSDIISNQPCTGRIRTHESLALPQLPELLKLLDVIDASDELLPRIGLESAILSPSTATHRVMRSYPR